MSYASWVVFIAGVLLAVFELARSARDPLHNNWLLGPATFLIGIGGIGLLGVALSATK